MQKRNNGITLIALVITIIVLLILAGVTIATLMGDNGILTKTGEAKLETRGGAVEEARNLWKTNQEADKLEGTPTAQSLDELLIDLEKQNLLTMEEVETIKETGRVTIGSRTIIFIEYASVAEVVSGNKKVTGSKEDPMYIMNIEDLAILSNESNVSGEEFYNTWITLQRNLDFNDNASYKNPNATTYIKNGTEVEFGDINGDGEKSGIKEELTTDQGFMPIGNGYKWMSDATTSFNGNINGNSKKISNLLINKIEVYEPGIGLIGNVNKQCIVENLTLENVDIKSSYTGSNGNPFGIGTICGIMKGKEEECIIQNCTVTGKISVGYANDVGGIVGAISNTDIRNSKSYCNIESYGDAGLDYAGGIVGECVDDTDEIEIENCENHGNMLLRGSEEGTVNWIGGIIGSYGGKKIENCKNFGRIEVINPASSYMGTDVGGIIGYGWNEIRNCANNGDIITSDTDEVGGIVGYLYSSNIKACYNTGNIQGDENVGGIIGTGRSTYVENCYNTAEVKGKNKIGGVTGTLGDYVTYSNGNVSKDDATLKNSYNIGMVIGEQNYGGIVGVFEKNRTESILENSYYLESASNTAYVDDVGTTSQKEAKTLEEMKQDSFIQLLNTGNTETIWKKDSNNVNNGYPILNWQN